MAPTPTTPPAPVRSAYGRHPLQHGFLHRAPGAVPRGTVVVIHGGFWRSGLGSGQLRPLAESLAAEGWNAWEIDYRTVGADGGWPETLDDILAAVEHLAVLSRDLRFRPGLVVTLGHSAGGQLAVAAAARLVTGHGDGVRVAGAVSLAGVLDLTQAVKDDLGDGATPGFLGGSPEEAPERYAAADPCTLAEHSSWPVWVRSVHAEADSMVPIAQSVHFTDVARAAGWDAELIPVEGDHFTVVSATDASWRKTLNALGELPTQAGWKPAG